MKTLSAAALTLLSFCTVAQPTLTQGSHEPQAGNTFLLYDHDSTNTIPRQTGAGQFWDFTSVKPAPAQTSPAAFTYSYMGNSAIPAASLFPGATIVNSWYTDEFFKSAPGAPASFEYLGFLSYGGHTLTLNDSKIIQKWPFAFGDSFTDSFAGAEIQSTGSVTIAGTISVSASGYGTLALPGGNTFNDVLQVTSFESRVSSAANFTETLYPFEQCYYIAGIREPLLRMTDANKMTTTDSVFILINKQVVAGIEEAAAKDWAIYPNPARDYVYVEFGTALRTKTPVTIIDPAGRTIKKVELPDGSVRTGIDIGELPAGTFFIKPGGAQRTAMHSFIKF